jgi:hypothetical protein
MTGPFFVSGSRNRAYSSKALYCHSVCQIDTLSLDLLTALPADPRNSGLRRKILGSLLTSARSDDQKFDHAT